MRRVAGDVLGVVVVTWDRAAWVLLSRIRLCGRTVESVLKESQMHGKTTPRISTEKKTRIVLSVIGHSCRATVRRLESELGGAPAVRS